MEGIRQNLQKIYEKVRTCKKCKKPYGSDIDKEKQPGLCPFCIVSYGCGCSRWRGKKDVSELPSDSEVYFYD